MTIEQHPHAARLLVAQAGEHRETGLAGELVVDERRVDRSTCMNMSNTCASALGAIPMPLSLTLTTASPFSWRVRIEIWPP